MNRSHPKRLPHQEEAIRLIDIATWQEVADQRGHADYVHAVAWSPDGTRLVSGSGDSTVPIWDSLSMQERTKRSQVVEKWIP